MSGFKDHFSADSAAYAAHRPAYPSRLFSHLAALTPDHGWAWDCATGSGQAAVGLANHFERVVATDASVQQIANARTRTNIDYLVARAERAPLPDASMDLVTVAQALHWFDIPKFFAEADRVLKPDGILAFWSYGLFRTNTPIDHAIDHLYGEVLAGYWPPERRMVEQGYGGVDLPFLELDDFHCEIEADRDSAWVANYLGTWSAVQRFTRERGADPLGRVREALDAPASTGRFRVRWPIRMRIGRKPGRRPA